MGFAPLENPRFAKRPLVHYIGSVPEWGTRTGSKS